MNQGIESVRKWGKYKERRQKQGRKKMDNMSTSKEEEYEEGIKKGWMEK